MNETTQKLIKAFAICLAIFIIVSIINTIVYFASNIFSVNNNINMNENYPSEIKNIIGVITIINPNSFIIFLYLLNIKTLKPHHQACGRGNPNVQ